MDTYVLKTTMRRLSTAAVATVAYSAPVLAQDTIGVQPVSTAAIATMKLIAAAALGYGFFRLMTGRHTVEGLTLLGVGGLGLAKTAALVALLGLG